MTTIDDAKTRTIELETEVDAAPEEVFRILTDSEEVSRWFPLEARIDPAVGGRVWLSWGPGCEGAAPVHIHEAPTRFGWTEQHGNDEQGRPIEIAVDFHVESRDGVTVVRLVQSGFSAEAKWDDMYDALVDGWRYFLFNLRHYVAHHRGTPRAMAWCRVPTALERSEVWRWIGSSGLVGGAGDAEPGDTVGTALGGGLEGRLVSARPGHHVAIELPALDRSLFFVEIEGRHVGFWLSTYGLDAQRVAALQAELDTLVEEIVP